MFGCTWVRALLGGALLLGGCTGVIETDGPSSAVQGAPTNAPFGPASASMSPGAPSAPPPAPACVPGAAAPWGLKHLTRTYYNNTVRDLLGDDTRPADAFPVDDTNSGFAVGRNVSPRLARDVFEAAERIAARAVRDVSRLVTCTSQDETCGRRFVDDFLPRAFRRPATADELSTFRALFVDGLEAHDFKTGIELVIRTALLSPQFFYLVEEASGPVASPWTMASRLSYFLTASMPDAPLFAAARADALSAPAAIEAQARRLMGLPAFAESARDLAAQWFGLSDIGWVEKSSVGFTPETARALERSAFAFAHHALVKRGTLQALLTDNDVFVDESTFALYGVPRASGASLVAVKADPAQRAGILTQAGLLAKLAKGEQPDAIHRGVFVRRAVLCEVLPAPPDVPPLPMGDDLGAQIRQHVDNPQCAGCHALIDPVGFGFDNYDGLGRYRAVDRAGLPIQTAGTVKAIDGGSFPFTSVRELATRLAASETVATCASRRWFRHAFRRSEADADECAITEAGRALRGGGTFGDLVLSLVRSPTFRAAPHSAPKGTP